MNDQWEWSVLAAVLCWPWFVATFVVGAAVGYCVGAWRGSK